MSAPTTMQWGYRPLAGGEADDGGVAQSELEPR